MSHHAVVQKGIELSALVDYSLKLFASTLLALGVSYVKNLNKSVESLNIKIALVIDHLNSHEKRIAFLEGRRKRS